MPGELIFAVGLVVGLAFGFWALRRQDARHDAEIEARRRAFDDERVRRIFERHWDKKDRSASERAFLLDEDWAQEKRVVVDTEIR